MTNPKLTAERLKRRAIVYVRQSSAGQVIHNQESQRRQYGLVDRAREWGFQDVQLIDDDLGRSGSGLVERPGFQRLVAEVCSGLVGAIFCIEASRLARNGRDWHHLVELCGMVGAVLVDPDGVYDPVIINDRLLLGLKGTMSEFELNLLRQRAVEAIRQKASRGELQYLLPVGFCWTSGGKIEIDPDRRVQQAIHLVFAKMIELGSARQVLIWFRREGVSLPALPPDPVERKMIWKLPVYQSVLGILTNPVYAGAYAYGKTEARTTMVNGRARKTVGHRKPRDQWTVLIPDHHPGYISWEQFERNQATLAQNTHMKSRMEPKAGRGGRALLAGLLRCHRCGRMLHVTYTGLGSAVIRYQCRGAHLNHGEGRCISFGALRPDQAVAEELLRAIGGNAVEAALQAADQKQEQLRARRQNLVLELDQARYEANLAARRYEAVDPDNRLVAAELEDRWNAALQRVRELDDKLQQFDRVADDAPIPDKEVLLSLARDLPMVWNLPTTDMRVKQRIVRILVREIVVDVDEQRHETVLVIHWSGGRHSELRVKKNRPGEHKKCTETEVVEVVRQMAGKFTDEQIASTLNRLGMRTGAGNTWNDMRVYSLRHHHNFPAHDMTRSEATMLTMEEVAHRLGLSWPSVRRLVERKTIPANQVVSCAPWQIPVEALESEAVRKAVRAIKNRVRLPPTQNGDRQRGLFSES